MSQQKDTYPIHQIELSNGAVIAYQDIGEGRPLVFVHGLGSNMYAWKKNVAELSQHYRCLALDLPGYGRSPKRAYDFSVDFLAESVKAFIEAMRLEEVVLLGHSMGGQVCMHLLIKHRVAVSKLILAAPAGLEAFNMFESRWFGTVMTPSLLKASSEAQIYKNISTNFYRFPEDAQFMVRERVALKEDAAALDYYTKMIAQCVNSMLKTPVIDRLHLLHTPTLIVYGEEDRLIPNRLLHPGMNTRDIAQKGQSLIRGSQMQMIPEAGHLLQFEQPEKFNSLVRGFVGKAKVRIKTPRETVTHLFESLEAGAENAFLACYAKGALLDSSLWGQLVGPALVRYLKIWSAKTQTITLLSLDEVLSSQQAQVTWRWKGQDPMTNKALSLEVQSALAFKRGKIIYQQDHVPLATYLAQSRGAAGKILGRTGFWQRKLKQSAQTYLQHKDQMG